MTSFFQTPRPQAAAGDRVLGLSEILPRISLIEEAVEGLRILEFGVIDVRSLIHLQEAGAERVAGTTATIEQLDRVSLAGHRI